MTYFHSRVTGADRVVHVIPSYEVAIGVPSPTVPTATKIPLPYAILFHTVIATPVVDVAHTVAGVRSGSGDLLSIVSVVPAESEPSVMPCDPEKDTTEARTL